MYMLTSPSSFTHLFLPSTCSHSTSTHTTRLISGLSFTFFLFLPRPYPSLPTCHLCMCLPAVLLSFAHLFLPSTCSHPARTNAYNPPCLGLVFRFLALPRSLSFSAHPPSQYVFTPSLIFFSPQHVLIQQERTHTTCLVSGLSFTFFLFLALYL
jgi:hypothetical protein